MKKGNTSARSAEVADLASGLVLGESGFFSRLMAVGAGGVFVAPNEEQCESQKQASTYIRKGRSFIIGGFE